VEAVMCLALRQGRELIGVHAVGYQNGLEVEGGKLRIARGISQIASVALANARLLEELDRANRLKQDFVGTISHELRTPLNVILGYNELLREGAFGELSSEQESILERMNRSATQLLDLINSTLDLSRLQSQDVLTALASLNVPELFAELEMEFRPLHQNSSVTLEWRVEPGLPPLRTDPVKLKMVLKNLIGNAIKFTHEGKVSTIASIKDGGMEFLVRDTGIGIPPDAHALVFEPFRQVDGSTTRLHGGVGLGLYIVRQLLELLGGTVSLESEVGKGSLFRVWVPYQRDSRQQILGDQRLI
jgi:signal transduction histidine kinase